MFARRKRNLAPAPDATLTLCAPDGAAYRAFPDEIVTSYRYMLTRLACDNPLPRRIAIVSALRQEGVTYTTLALAAVLANDFSANVCMVDLNWWSPGLLAALAAPAPPRRRFRKPLPELAAPPVPRSPGLAAVLDGRATFAEALVPTGMPNLALLPAGDVSPAQWPIVARGERLQECFQTLSQRFDHVLLDVPALRSTSDAIALASLGDACCLVVRQGVTSVSNVQRSLDDIKHLRILGVILNQAAVKTPRWLLSLVPRT